MHITGTLLRATEQMGAKDLLRGRLMEKTSKDFSVQAVERAIKLLQTFSIERPSLGVTELSRMYGLHKSTVSRLLATLEKARLVEQDPITGKYFLGLGLLPLLAAVRTDLREISRTPLQQLCNNTHETVSLAILDGEEVINIDQVLSQERQVKHVGWIGRRAPLHCSSTGKVLLAYRPKEEIEKIIAGGLPPRTARTITDPEELRKELVRIRQQGYAVAVEEFEEGLAAVAAPVYDHRGDVIACVCVAGPTFRISPDRNPPLTHLTVRTAEEISRRLGYAGAMRDGTSPDPLSAEEGDSEGRALGALIAEVRS